jgi:gamma-glutamylcyclotransferase (GGCT)/AIG2-like uncharacterized protein YtfP
MKVFVYGSLRPDVCGGRPSLLSGLYEKGRIYSPNFLMYDFGAYPGIVPTFRQGTKPVVGLVFDVDYRKLKELDFLEGCEGPTAWEASLYVRQQHTVVLEEDENVQAWVYIYSGFGEGLPKHATRIKSGDYRDCFVISEGQRSCP